MLLTWQLQAVQDRALAPEMATVITNTERTFIIALLVTTSSHFNLIMA